MQQKQLGHGVVQEKTVEVSPAAYHWMVRENIPPEYIAALVNKCSELRYDKCVEKVARMAQRPNYLVSGVGEERVLLPYYFDMMARGDGQCSDINKALIIWIYATGWLDDINCIRARYGKAPLVVRILSGNSPEFFETADANHFWMGLTVLGEGDYSCNQVFVDASFDVICCMNDVQNYVLKIASYDNPALGSDVHFLAEIGVVWTSDGVLSSYNFKSTVLGISRNREVSFGFAFVRVDEVLSPIVVIRPPSSYDFSMRPMVAWFNGRAVWSEHTLRMSDDVYDEVNALLYWFSEIKLERTHAISVQPYLWNYQSICVS